VYIVVGFLDNKLWYHLGETPRHDQHIDRHAEFRPFDGCMWRCGYRSEIKIFKGKKADMGAVSTRREPLKRDMPSQDDDFGMDVNVDPEDGESCVDAYYQEQVYSGLVCQMVLAFRNCEGEPQAVFTVTLTVRALNCKAEIL
jgi:hypothetical protein